MTNLNSEGGITASLTSEGNLKSTLSIGNPVVNLTLEQLKELTKVPELTNTKFDHVTAEMNSDETATKLTFYANGVAVDMVVVQGGKAGQANATTFTSSTNSELKVTKNSDAIIDYTFTTSFNDTGTLQILVNGSLKKTLVIDNGTGTINVAEFLQKGSNEVTLKVTNSVGANYPLIFYIDVIDLSVTTTFDHTKAYDNDIEVLYKISGNINKTMHFLLDDVEIGTEEISNTSTIQKTYTIPQQEHGVHKFKMYASTTIDENIITSNIVEFEIICVVDGNNTVLISSSYIPEDVEQYTLISIPYIVYNPSSIYTDISLYINDELINELTVGRGENKWNINDYPYGEVTFSIRTNDGSVVKDFTITVTEVEISIVDETNGLELHLTSKNRTNSDINKEVWSYNDIIAEFNGFNWTSNGWVLDSSGYSVLRINNGSSAVIPIKPFSKDLKSTGKTIEIEFKVSEVIDYDSTMISCMSGNRGFELTCRKALFKSNESTIETLFKDNEKIRVSFAIEQSSYDRLIYTYINGVMSGITQYVETDIFSQTTPVGISLGSESCTLDIYNIRVYNNCLQTTSIMNNYIYDLNDVTEKLNLYNKNSVYDSSGSIVYSKILNQLPCLTITGDLPSAKGDKKTVRVVYENKEDYTKDFDYNDVVIDIQGTSSQYYPKKNYKIKLKTEYKLRDTSIAEKVFCLKADYMESSHSHNTGVAKIVHSMYSEPVPPQEINDSVRTTIDGFPIAVFYKETEESEIKYFGIYNFNNDKDDVTTFGYSDKAECWEICNNTSDRCLFQVSEYDNLDTDGNPEWLTDFEARYPEDNTDYKNIKKLTDWIVSTKNDPDKFKSEYESHFNKHYLLVYFIITEMFAMVDSRAKNMFLATWDGSIWYPVFYDMDTCFGLNNEGVLAFDYNVETQDTIGTQNVFNGKNSLLWQQVETTLSDEIAELYIQLRDNKKLTYDKVLAVLEEEQIKKICEAQYNEDATYKYLDPLRNENISTYLYIAQGNRLNHLKYWLFNRFNYMDSRYMASDYKANYATLRLYTPETYSGVEPNANFIITPYSSQYINVKFGSYMRGMRATNNQPITIEAPDITFNDTETIIYGASRISNLGNLSNKYAGTVDVSKATQLNELLIGSDAEGYSNTNLKELSIGNNNLLRKLDVRNCPNLTIPIDVSNCNNIEEIYAEGTNVTSVKLPNSDSIKVLHLPSSVTNITLVNKTNITDFTCEGYNNVSLLRVENSSINPLGLLSYCTNIEFVRMMDLNHKCSYLALNRLMGCKGMDENGNEIDIKNAVSGKITISKCSQEMFDEYVAFFPLVEFTLESLVKQYEVTFLDGDGNILYVCKTIENGEAVYVGDTPTKTSTAQYDYEWYGWDSSLSPIIGDCTIKATFTSVTRWYTIKFVNSETDEVISSQYLEYGSIPTKPDLPEGLNSWSSMIYPVTKDTTYYAIYEVYPDDLSIFTFTSTTINDVEGYSCGLNTDSTLPTTIIFPFEYEDKPVLEITGIAYTEDFVSGVNTVYIPKNVIRLGNNSFRNFKQITELDLTNITTLGSYCFYSCSALTSVDLPSATTLGNSCFYTCSALTSIDLPLATTLGYSSFVDCKSLKSINAPSVITFDNNCFSGCSALTSIDLPSVTRLGSYCFYNCKSLKSINAPSATTLGNNCFHTCSALTSIDLPLATTISYNCFYNCSALTSVNLPSATTLGYSCFYNCSALTSIDLPLVTTLGDNFFNKCSALTSVNLPLATTISYNCFYNCSALTSVNLPLATTLGNNCFTGCSKLTSIDLPSATTLGNACFQSCTKLTTVEFPSYVTTLGSSCFDSCESLTELIFGSIGNAIASTSGWDSTAFSAYVSLLTLYTSDGTGDSLTGSPWGATNATIVYEQA